MAASTLVVPCLAGGVARISTDDDGADRVVLDACAMHDADPPADGSGTISWYGSTAELAVRTAAGSLDFTLDDDTVSATGTWDGRTYTLLGVSGGSLGRRGQRLASRRMSTRRPRSTRPS